MKAALTIFGIAATALADQATKAVVLSLISPGQVLPVLPSFDLTLSFNEGASFGMMSNLMAGRPLLMAGLTGALALIFAFMAFRTDNRFERTGQPEWAIHGAPDLDRAWRIAGAVGLDLERAQSDRLHPDTTAILNQDVADLQELGVRATPTFFLDGRPLTNPNFDALRDAVGNAVAETS